MLILRIRQAETALWDGRLDEAFDLARREEVRSHRQGQQLVGDLARALVARGWEHLKVGRLSEAMSDCGKAARLAGNSGDIAALRGAIEQAMSKENHNRHRHADVLACARECLDNGMLSGCEDLLASAEGETRRIEALRGEAAARRADADASLRRVEVAIERQDWSGAIEGLLAAWQTHASSDRLASLAAAVTDRVGMEIRAALDTGRLDRANLLMCRLRKLPRQGVEMRELSRALSKCQLAFECIEQGRLRQASEALRQLSALLPEAAWVRDALAHAEQTATGLEALRGGPLGLVSPSGSGASSLTVAVNDAPPAGRPDRLPASPDKPDGCVPMRFMLQIDGVGGFLVLLDRQITVGPAASSRSPDLPLMADRNLPPIRIERLEDDYFVSATDGVLVNGRAARRSLLSDGDKIGLSQRCRLRFGLPHPASSSAVLDVSGSRLPTGDVRRVILLDRNLVIGPAGTSHIRTDRVIEPIVLSVRDGRLLCGSSEPMTVDDRVVDRSTGIPMNSHVCVGPLSFVMVPA
ncbi:MAG: hypothetical protein JXQ73_20265 [Phycisphaerae bacterium]|nr:hypothetical protein [Phycisphaerae bacterium]